MKHLTILNPTAGGYSAAEHEKISQALSGLEGKVLATPTLAALEQQLQEEHHYHPDLLGIGGGDGTASHTLTAVNQIWGQVPEYLAVYGIGTINNVAVPLGTSKGLLDKIKLFTGLGNSRPVQLAKYIQRVINAGKKPNTEELAPLYINGRWGFNLGFGLVPKLVWRYYGRSMEQYLSMEKELQGCPPEQHDALLEKIVAENPAKKSGLLQAGKTALQSMASIVTPSSPGYQFLHQPLDAKVCIDGNQTEFPHPPRGIYIASYEQQNAGLFRGSPAPAARAVPGKMEVVITYASVKEIVMGLPAMLRGRHIRNTWYGHAQELKIESDQVMIGQVDAEFVFAREFTVKCGKPLKFISLKS